MRFIGANPAPRIVGRDELPGKTNYFIKRDPSKWRVGVSSFARVEYENVYPGVSLAFYGVEGQRLEYDCIVQPGVDPEIIRLTLEGPRRRSSMARATSSSRSPADSSCNTFPASISRSMGSSEQSAAAMRSALGER
jgi:hypothetical protein